MPGCSALHCSNRSEKGFLLKSFPRDPIRRAQWEAKVKRDGWHATNSSFLCDVHFDEAQWEKTRVDGTRKLKCNAVPTIFSFTRPSAPREAPRKWELPLPPTKNSSADIIADLSSRGNGKTYCSAVNCTNRRRPNLTLFSFPQGEQKLERCKRWVYNMRRKGVVPDVLYQKLTKEEQESVVSTKYLFLCEAHFDIDQYMNPAHKGVETKHKRMRHDAIPTIFDRGNRRSRSAKDPDPLVTTAAETFVNDAARTGLKRSFRMAVKTLSAAKAREQIAAKSQERAMDAKSSNADARPAEKRSKKDSERFSTDKKRKGTTLVVKMATKKRKVLSDANHATTGVPNICALLEAADHIENFPVSSETKPENHADWLKPTSHPKDAADDAAVPSQRTSTPDILASTPKHEPGVSDVSASTPVCVTSAALPVNVSSTSVSEAPKCLADFVPENIAVPATLFSRDWEPATGAENTTDANDLTQSDHNYAAPTVHSESARPIAENNKHVLGTESTPKVPKKKWKRCIKEFAGKTDASTVKYFDSLFGKGFSKAANKPFVCNCYDGPPAINKPETGPNKHGSASCERHSSSAFLKVPAASAFTVGAETAPSSSDLTATVPTSSDLTATAPTSSDLTATAPTSSDLTATAPTSSDLPAATSGQANGPDELIRRKKDHNYSLARSQKDSFPATVSDAMSKETEAAYKIRISELEDQVKRLTTKHDGQMRTITNLTGSLKQIKRELRAETRKHKRLKAKSKTITKAELKEAIRSHLPEEAFALFCAQIDNEDRGRRSHRFSDDVKLIAATLRELSPSAYDLLCAILILPTKTTLERHDERSRAQAEKDRLNMAESENRCNLAEDKNRSDLALGANRSNVTGGEAGSLVADDNDRCLVIVNEEHSSLTANDQIRFPGPVHAELAACGEDHSYVVDKENHLVVANDDIHFVHDDLAVDEQFSLVADDENRVPVPDNEYLVNIFSDESSYVANEDSYQIVIEGDHVSNGVDILKFGEKILKYNGVEFYLSDP